MIARDFFSISPCTPDDIAAVCGIEVAIEGTAAAREATIRERYEIYREGFLVAKEGDEVIGYLESTIWRANDRQWETFAEIKDFPARHHNDGDTLYIIFLAVRKDKRRRGVGGRLLQAIKVVARERGLARIQLVAKEHLVDYYKRFGFVPVRELPHFLEGKPYRSILMEGVLAY